VDSGATQPKASSPLPRAAMLRRIVVASLLLAGLVLLSSEPIHAQSGPANPGPSPAPAPALAPLEGVPGAVVPAKSTRPPKKTFLQIFFSGGPVGIANMLALIGLSLTAVYMVFDNLMRIRRKDLVPLDLASDLRKLVEQGRLEEAIQLCKSRPCYLTNVVRQGLSEASSGWSEVEKAMEDAMAEQAAKLFRWIEYLSVIGNLAPMVGLLGTVTGMLLAFKEVAETEGNAGAAQLADGIYQALVTTVYGLVIAIPALGFFALFRSWIDELIAEAAYESLHIVAPLKQRSLALQAPPMMPPAGLPAAGMPGVQPPPPPRGGSR
jgi:biopolymer transport protein ExbB